MYYVWDPYGPIKLPDYLFLSAKGEQLFDQDIGLFSSHFCKMLLLSSKKSKQFLFAVKPVTSKWCLGLGCSFLIVTSQAVMIARHTTRENVMCQYILIWCMPEIPLHCFRLQETQHYAGFVCLHWTKQSRPNATPYVMLDSMTAFQNQTRDV